MFPVRLGITNNQWAVRPFPNAPKPKQIEYDILFNFSSLESGSDTMPTCGSIVQKGKFSAGALDFVNALKSVDFPTFGSPTIPHCKDILK